ncbi:MAG TPA: DUF58 domain-containing protein [Thermoanaerobaculia bacterium]|nr:DUF58 domain-containing protein [Thermoanaerobaculia bacterium]
MAGDTFTFNGVVRLTRVGTGFVLFTIVIGFAAINTGNNSLYIGLTFMLGALLLSGIASKGGLKHLVVDFSSVDEAWAGRVAEGRLRIANDSRIWNVRDVIIVSQELAHPVFVPVVPRRGAVDVDVQFLFAHRGRVELRQVDLYTRYPFGFFLKKRRMRISGEVIVFPRLLESDGSRGRFAPIEGELSSANRIGHGTDVHSFRDYVRGDSLRHVYWKKSASLGRWIMKQTELDAGRAVHVVLDPYKPREVADDEFEQMISEAATFIHDSLERSVEVVLTMPRISLRASGGDASRALFRALALIEATHEPVEQTLERGALLFSVRRVDDAKSA